MTISLDRSALPEYLPPLADPDFALAVHSIRAGHTAAEAWALGPPGAGLVLWDQGNNVLYLAAPALGPDELPAARQALDALIDAIRPRAVAAGLERFKARALDPSAAELLPALGAELRAYPSSFFRYPRAQPPAAPEPPGVSFAPIDQALLDDPAMDGAGRVRAEIRWMWGDEAHFYAHGWGVAALAGPRIVCACTSEYVSAERCGIGIETLAGFERRGIATATAARFVAAALERGCVPHWECASANLASLRVAAKLGFAPLGEEPFWLGSFAAP